MNIKRLRVSRGIDRREFETNCYVIENNKKVFIVDPGANHKKINKYIHSNEFEVEGILLTHGHFDHLAAIPNLLNTYNVPIYIHEEDLDMLFSASRNMSKHIISIEIAISKKANIKIINDSETLYLDDEPIQVIHTPGHTNGSVSFFIKSVNTVLTGDTLFNMGIGRTDLYGGNERKLRTSIFEKLAKLPDDTHVFSGHGLNTNIKRAIDYIKERDIL